jgi:undecaprenyl pyrophosphate phosphatase UppP
MSLVDVIVLAVLQGFAELLPVSSSAHVIVAEKLMGLDPSSPPMTLLLVMLHTGTMFAVIAYFWHMWRGTYFQSFAVFKNFAGLLILATVLTGVVGEAFRGFSRSGATISAGMLAGVSKSPAETFSFALAVVLTPPVVFREAMRLIHAQNIRGTANLTSAMFPSVLGAVLAFLAGLLALRWLSRWLEGGRWYLFGIYCLAAAAVVAGLHHVGY